MKKILISIIIVLVFACIGIAVFFMVRERSLYSTKGPYKRSECDEKGSHSDWSVEYGNFEGRMSRYLKPVNDTLHMEVTTRKGTVDVSVEDKSGNVLYEKNDVKELNENLDVDVMVKVIVTTKEHAGKFTFEF